MSENKAKGTNAYLFGHRKSDNGYTNITVKRIAEKAVQSAMEDGIYTILYTADSIEDERAILILDACKNAIREAGIDSLSVEIHNKRAKVVPKGKIAVIVYDRDVRNPYLDYGFRHQSIIIRRERRATEQTIQLIEAARRERADLDDLIVHTCVTQQHNSRRYLIIICRGTDTYKRAIFKDGKKVPVHDSNTPPVTTGLRDTYMLKCLDEFGNTVVRPGFIRKHGAERAAEILSEKLHQGVSIRFVSDMTGEYYIAEIDDARGSTWMTDENIK